MAKRKSKTRLLIKRCDDLWRAVIHLKYYCEVCGAPPPLKENGERGNHNAHHIIGKSNYNLRWDIKNGCNLCAGDHTLKGDSAHKNPIKFVLWLQEHRLDDYNYLVSVQHLPKPAFRDYEKIIEDLTNILERSENGF